MHTYMKTLVVAAALGITAQQAAAVVTFAFDDNPDPQGQFVYSAPAGQRALGLLEYNSRVPVDLDVDATGEGGNEYAYQDSIFTFSADVGVFSDSPIPGTYFAPLTNGVFTFSASSDARASLLMTGTFGFDPLNPAYLVIVVDTGSINVSALVGGLVITPTDRLLGDLSEPSLGNISTEVIGFSAPFDSVWTLSNMSNLSTRYINNGQARGVFLEDFIANSSYSGTAGRVVPSPASAALAGLGLAFAGLRRKR